MQKLSFFRNNLRTARLLMVAAILLIVAFQSYWLSRLYREEREAVRKEANNIFRDVVYNLQSERLKSDTLFRATIGPNIFVRNVINDLSKNVRIKKKPDSVFRFTPDSTRAVTMMLSHSPDSAKPAGNIVIRRGVTPVEMEQLIRQQMIAAGGAPGFDSITGTSVGMRIIVNDRPKADSILKAIAPPIAVPKVEIKYTHSDSISLTRPDSVRRMGFTTSYSESDIVRLITRGNLLDDSIPIARIDSAYRKELGKARIPLDFTVRMGMDDSLHRRDTLPAGSFATRPASVGFLKPAWYQAELDNPTAFLVRKVSPQILFSIFLVAFTSITFIFLYRNLAQQRRLTEMKNDFISNITHELKTPIATVSVAVEALRNFGGMDNPARTKEYLDISAAELQRLGLLVDKVLKLSLFENRGLELKREPIDLLQILQEVTNTMRLQFDKQKAKLNIEVQGAYFVINADRLHITSVIYNLLDNALKYSPSQPEIKVVIRHDTDKVILSVADKGLGIPAAFQSKIFDKFFRVPTGDHHNIKGYGLGLSYVAQVVKEHDGSIAVESEPGKGSTFTVKLPIA